MHPPIRIRTTLLPSAALAALLAATPALGLDVGVTVTVLGPATDPFRAGTTAELRARISNGGPEEATNVTVDATLPADFDLNPIGAAAGCASADQLFPCTVAAIPAGGFADVTFSAEVVPGTTCPSAGETRTVLVTASAAGDTDPLNDTGSAARSMAPYADLAVTVTGPATASEGGSVTFDTTITNDGPCGAAAATAFAIVSGLLQVTLQSGPCGVADATVRGCLLGDPWPAGATVSFTHTFSVGTFPDDVIEGPVPYTILALSDLPPASATHDQDLSNNAVTVRPIVQTGNEFGCGTAGAGTLAGVAALVALGLAGRRSS